MNKLSSILILLILSAACFAAKQEQEDAYGEYDYDGLPGTGEAAQGENQATEDEQSQKGDDLPVFLSSSKEISAKEGDSVEFSCKTTKPTQHVLIFKKEDTLIYVGDMQLAKAQKIENIDGVFRLTNITRKDAGSYICHFQSKPPEEITYELNVKFPPLVFSKTPKVQRIQKGATVSMRCQARGNPTPVIRWSKEKGKLPSGSDSEEGFSLTLEDVNRHVEGTYLCTADNGVGSPISESMKILVEYPPEITTEKAIVRTGEGDKVELVCIVHSRPAAVVTWSKDDAPLTPEGDVTEKDGGHRHSIIISPVSEENFGSYQCNAANEQGEDKAVINLTDLPKKPLFTSPATSAVETMYTLVWETESYYPITEYNIKYRPVKANDSTNEPGEWKEEPVEVQPEDVDTDGLKHIMKHTLKDLLPATDYEARVSVKNKYKWGAEEVFKFSTRKAPPTTTTTTTTTSLPLVFIEETVELPAEGV